ncbi:MAG TPA: efflux RND transporter periplasmic adaptor subunit, partial [Vicinamibacterales bacterium]|nr:efflux RND transporter periplasmic adaptor subunit [Vicinamibacterales bacterium]
GPRLPMTVEIAPVKRADMATEITVVGNLVGAATVEAVPKVAGRLESVSVRMGDRVSRGQTIAKVEDRELLEQIKQAQASFEVAAATIRQREADLRLAQSNLDRSRNLYERQLIPKQTFDDTDARYQASVAQLDLARAQFSQSQARLDELKINLTNTTISSPVSGFVGKRVLDPGAWVTPNSAFISVVDIGVVRLVANIVEKDIRRITSGLPAMVEVDAYPGEQFHGIVKHISPVLDPATRTGQIEVEIPNTNFRLKPGMYAKVAFTVDKKENTLVVPTAALVDLGGNRGVFMTSDTEQGPVASFKKVDVGIVNQTLAEVTSGLTEGETVVTTGAAALREGDRILLPGQSAAPGGEGARGGQGRGQNGEGRRGGGQGRGRGNPAPGVPST